MAEPARVSASSERTSLKLSAPDGSRPRLLLAEDCDPVRIVTAAMLKGMGCDVEAVVHGEQAVKSAAENSFDVIVLGTLAVYLGPSWIERVAAVFRAEALASRAAACTIRAAMPDVQDRSALAAALAD